MMVYETHNCSIHGVIIQQTSLGASIQGERMAPKTQVVRRVCATTGLGLLFHRLPETRGLKRRALADAQPRGPSMSKYPVIVCKSTIKWGPISDRSGATKTPI